MRPDGKVIRQNANDCTHLMCLGLADVSIKNNLEAIKHFSDAKVAIDNILQELRTANKT
jgi:hypothetical protein